MTDADGQYQQTMDAKFHKPRHCWFQFTLRGFMLWIVPYVAIMAWIFRPVEGPTVTTGDVFGLFDDGRFMDTVILLHRLLSAIAATFAWGALFFVVRRRLYFVAAVLGLLAGVAILIKFI